jgi:hypothetical protein
MLPVVGEEKVALICSSYTVIRRFLAIHEEVCITRQVSCSLTIWGVQRTSYLELVNEGNVAPHLIAVTSKHLILCEDWLDYQC